MAFELTMAFRIFDCRLCKREHVKRQHNAIIANQHSTGLTRQSSDTDGVGLSSAIMLTSYSVLSMKPGWLIVREPIEAADRTHVVYTLIGEGAFPKIAQQLIQIL